MQDNNDIWPKKSCGLMTQFIDLISNFTNCQIKISGNNTILQNDKNFFEKLINSNVCLLKVLIKLKFVFSRTLF